MPRCGVPRSRLSPPSLRWIEQRFPNELGVGTRAPKGGQFPFGMSTLGRLCLLVSLRVPCDATTSTTPGWKTRGLSSPRRDVDRLCRWLRLLRIVARDHASRYRVGDGTCRGPVYRIRRRPRRDRRDRRIAARHVEYRER